MSSPFAYCPNCGKENPPFLNQKQLLCDNCHFEYFHNTASAVGVLLRFLGQDTIRYLLIRRANQPSRGLLDVPGGFVDQGETLEQAASREFQEELGIRLGIDTLEPKYFCSVPNQYFYNNVMYFTTDIFFIADLLTSATNTLDIDSKAVLAESEVQSLEWVDPFRLLSSEMAFDSGKALLEILKNVGSKE